MTPIKRTITEIKRHVNKPTEQYVCELLSSKPGHMILRYVSDRTFASTRLGVTFPPGCITIAYYWGNRPYVFWGIFSPSEELLGYLVHICKDLNILDGAVSYLDMLLDIWFFPDGRHIILDEDEVEECLQAGLLEPGDAAFIEKAKQTAVADFEANSRSLADFTATLDISGERT